MEEMLFYLSIFSELYDALTRMLLSYINAYYYLQWPTLSLEGIGGIIFSLLEISAFSFLFIFGIFLVRRIFKEDGIVIMPFELPTNVEMKFNGRHISDILIKELRRIERINNTKLKGPRVIPWQPEINPEGESPKKLQISPNGETLEFGITELGTVGFGSNSLSLGNLIIAFKRLCPFTKPVSIVAGSVGIFGSEVKLTACLERDESFAWEVSKKLGKNHTSDMHIPNLIRDLAYQICFDLDKMEHKPNISSTTWRGFKHLTDALDQYHNFELTAKATDLRRSRRSCIKALYSERKYTKAINLIKILGYTYLEMANKSVKSEMANTLFAKLKNQSDYRDVSINLFEKHLGRFDPSEAHFGLGCVYMDAGEDEKALAEFKTATMNRHDYRSYYYQSILEKKLGKDSEISRRAFIRSVPKDPKGNYYAGSFHEALGESEAAINRFKEVTNQVPQSHEDWSYKGLSLIKLSYNENDQKIRSEYLEKALNAFQEIINKYPRDGEAWYYLGICYFRLENYKKAVDAFGRATEISPDNELFERNWLAALDSYKQEMMNKSGQGIDDLNETTSRAKSYKIKIKNE
jgi:tetratricopeptide (TPR) repeat protein